MTGTEKEPPRVTLKLNVTKSELSVESTYVQPEFGIFANMPSLLRSLFTSLQHHGLRLQDMKIERGAGSVGEFHLVCYLYSFMMAVRVRADKVEINCFEVPEDYVERFSTAMVGALSAVQQHLPTLAFRSHAMGVGLHGTLEGESVKNYLAKFAGKPPSGLGPPTGSGAVHYFGAEEDRLFASVTVDLSAVLSDGLYIRPYVIWNGKQLNVASIPQRAVEFIRHAVNSFGLEVPTLRS